MDDLELATGEDEDNNENVGLMRNVGRNEKGSYASVSTNASYHPSQSSSKICSCMSFICKAVVYTTAIILIGASGFYIGLSRPDLLNTVLNTTLLNTVLNTTAGNNIAKFASSVVGSDIVGQDINETDSIGTNIQVEENKNKYSKVRYYDPSTVLANGNNMDNDEFHNPFNRPLSLLDNNLFENPPKPYTSVDDGDDVTNDSQPIGYFTSPHLVNNKLVFLTEGDAYVTQLSSDSMSTSLFTSTKVTTTVGNVLAPKLHPTLSLLAYTATYSGRRDVYLMDMSSDRKLKTPLRLTYWDLSNGVAIVIGWIKLSEESKHANALVIKARSNDVSLPDYRLYILHLESSNTIITSSEKKDIQNSSVLEITPVPLAQAIDTAYTPSNKCWYFVRMNQSSNTIRYVGGTAENIWKYCDDDTTTTTSSQRLFHDDSYKGTSKSPQLYYDTGDQGNAYLFFLSDRGPSKENEWIPDRMNVWALKLNKDDTNNANSNYSTKDIIQITDTSCDFEGRTIQEYSVDEGKGNLVVRIGADLYYMSKEDMQSKIDKGERERGVRRLDDEMESYSSTAAPTEDYESNSATDAPTEDDASILADDNTLESASNVNGIVKDDIPTEDDASTVAGDSTLDAASTAAPTGDDTSIVAADITFDAAPTASPTGDNTAIVAADSTLNAASTAAPTGDDTAIVAADNTFDVAPTAAPTGDDTSIVAADNALDVASTAAPTGYDTSTVAGDSTLDAAPTAAPTGDDTSIVAADNALDAAPTAAPTGDDTSIVAAENTLDAASTTAPTGDNTAIVAADITFDVAPTAAPTGDNTATVAADITFDVAPTAAPTGDDTSIVAAENTLDAASNITGIVKDDIPTEDDAAIVATDSTLDAALNVSSTVKDDSSDSTNTEKKSMSADALGGNKTAATKAAIPADSVEPVSKENANKLPESAPDTVKDDEMVATSNLRNTTQNQVSGTVTTGEDANNIDTEGVNSTNSTKSPAKYYYDFKSPELLSRAAEKNITDHYSGQSSELKRLPIALYSDLYNEQERIIPVNIMKHYTYGDVFETITGSTKMLLTLRGQVWVAPITDDDEEVRIYNDMGKNLPARRYRIAPGSMMGGVTRILAAMHVPNPAEDHISDRRLAVLLATDPLTSTAEHAFYLTEVQPGASPLFVDMQQLPKPFLGGMVSGGSTQDGGLGSVKADTLAMSPCGNRMAWSDTDGRIIVMNLPQYQELHNASQPVKFVVLPQKNELDEPMVGDEVALVFSPGGRYLAITHNARNQFTVISIADLGDALKEENKISDIDLGRIVQATPSRFNSCSPYWGKTATDIHDLAQNRLMSSLLSVEEPDDVSTTIFFLSDRDIKSDVTSPWGSRQRMPHFVNKKAVYALPFKAAVNETSQQEGQFRGGGVEELSVDTLLKRMDLVESLLGDKAASPARRLEKRKLADSLHPLFGAFGYADKAFKEQKRRKTRRQLAENSEEGESEEEEDDHLNEAIFPKDMDIDFGPVDLTFARQAYRISTIPDGDYSDILCQNPDGSLMMIEDNEQLTIFQVESFPSDKYQKMEFKAATRKIAGYKLSSCRNFFYLIYSPDGAIRVVPNTAAGLVALLPDVVLDYNVVDKNGMHLSIWPSLEYHQMFNDAWRMLRDYFYDPDMTGIDWPAIHKRYLPLVERCTKREELDDVLIQMSSELSALHVFVYGGEYNDPAHDDETFKKANEVGSLGAVLKRTPAWKGYTVMSIPEADPDFTKIDHSVTIYSPLSDQSLRLSGQRGLLVGDVIVGVNSESVMTVPDIHMLLRGTAGRSIRLEVLRLASGATTAQAESKKTQEEDQQDATIESLIAVPLSPTQNEHLLYNAWEWKTEQLSQKLAKMAGISVGYVHLKDMSGAEAEDAFARGFFPNYHKQGFILDVRHNRGGNIDSWVLDVLQRKPWMYWQSRDYNPENGGIGWDEHFAFRGHVVVLLDENTSSDGEGVSRGIKELGLGKLVGTRTWGGGIWLASDNHLVDGGIATAPEIGTYNTHLSWGLEIEQMGVDPDFVVDNDPHMSFHGKDQQLEKAIEVLTQWIEEEPVVIPKPKGEKKDMTMGDRECKAPHTDR